MTLPYLTVNHLDTKCLTRIFLRIYIHPDVEWGGTPCWVWCGCRSNVSGYGTTSYLKHKEQVHRLIYAWLVCPIPVGSKYGELDHLCRNRQCCNPIHLEFVTGVVNRRRGNGWAGKNSRKTHCLRGHPFDGSNLIIKPNGKRRCRKCDYTRNKIRKIWMEPHHVEKRRLYREANKDIIRQKKREAYYKKKQR